MRKIILMLAALVMGAGLATMVSTGSAQAAPAPTTSKMRSDNCINPTEKANLRLGWTTKQVNAYTKAHPWLHVNDSINGTRYAIYAYDDCRNSGKVVGVAYRIAADGTQHYAMARYITI
jgi:hypothetical protein